MKYGIKYKSIPNNEIIYILPTIKYTQGWIGVHNEHKIFSLLVARHYIKTLLNKEETYKRFFEIEKNSFHIYD